MKIQYLNKKKLKCQDNWTWQIKCSTLMLEVEDTLGNLWHAAAFLLLFYAHSSKVSLSLCLLYPG